LHSNARKKGGGKMAQGYCVKCKSKKEMKDAKEVTMKNKRKAMKGKCPTCGTSMFCILGK
jgi:hypothetical protein